MCHGAGSSSQFQGSAANPTHKPQKVDAWDAFCSEILWTLLCMNRPTVCCLAGLQNPATTESAVHANPRRTPPLQGCEDWRRPPVLHSFTFF